METLNLKQYEPGQVPEIETTDEPTVEDYNVVDESFDKKREWRNKMSKIARCVVLTFISLNSLNISAAETGDEKSDNLLPSFEIEAAAETEPEIDENTLVIGDEELEKMTNEVLDMTEPDSEEFEAGFEKDTGPDEYVETNVENVSSENFESRYAEFGNYYEEGQVKISEASQEELRSTLRSYLESLSDNEKQRIIDNGYVTIFAAANDHPVTMTYPAEANDGTVYTITDNEVLAESRGAEDAKVAKPVLKEVLGVDIEVEVKVPDNDGLKDKDGYSLNGVNLDKDSKFYNQRYSVLGIHDVLESSTADSEAIEEIKESLKAQYDFSEGVPDDILKNALAVVTDDSGSMKADIEVVKKAIERVNEVRETNIPEHDLEVKDGFKELHMETLSKLVAEAPSSTETKFIIVYTDEPDAAFGMTGMEGEIYDKAAEKYEAGMKKLIADAEAKNIQILIQAYNPMHSTEYSSDEFGPGGGHVVVSLNENVTAMQSKGFGTSAVEKVQEWYLDAQSKSLHQPEEIFASN